MATKIRGLKDEQELNEEYLYRDTRTMLIKFIDWLRVPTNMAIYLSILALSTLFFPTVADFIFVIALLSTMWGMTRAETCPIKMPIQSGALDRNEPHPASGKPTPAQGIFYLGNEMDSGKEIWITNSDCRQHFLVIGTTGAGKTELLIGFGANAVSWGSGFLFCDGKGDVSLFAKIYALLRRFGREDDLLVLNFMTGNQDLGSSGGKLLSNTLNPFATGSSDTLTQMVVSLMDDVGGDGAMWKGRATAMFTGVMRALTWLRDNQIIDLNIGEIRDHLNLKRIIDLADENKHPEMPKSIRKSIRSYLTSLPGFQEEKGHKQSQTTLDQHGYLEMQFTKVLGSLADVYGHIFLTPHGEVDMYDVVLNRRILVIMLPALEKSPDELANLGKIVVATLKGMMGATLGSQIEGNWENVVDNRPTNSPSPFLVILDEVGYYTVSGMALMAAQARSLGFGMVYASQDIPAMLKLNDKEAKSIIANTNTKVFMRIEEMEETGKLAEASGGEGLKSQVGGYSGKAGEAGLSYQDTLEARVEKTHRVNTLDLKAQGSGEMTVIFQDKVIRGKSFYANPENAVNKKKLKIRTNHFIKIPKPDAEDMETNRRAPEILQKLLSDEQIPALKKAEAEALSALPQALEVGDEIAQAVRVYNAMLAKKRSSMEASCAVIAQLIRTQKSAVAGFVRQVQEASPIDDLLDEEMGSDLAMLGDRDEEGDVSEVDRILAKAGEARRRRLMSRVDPDVEHTVSVTEGKKKTLVDITERISNNESVMRALASLDYDPEENTEETVDNNINEAISVEGSGIEEAFHEIEREALVQAEDDITKAMGPSDNVFEYMEGEDAEEEGESSGSPKGSEEQDMTNPIDFIESLLSDDD